MSQFHQQSWDTRYASMGDEAEGLFKLLFPNSARFGLDRPPVNLTRVPEFIRFMPDFLLHNRLVECMGVGRDQILKLKVDKLLVLLEWDELHETHLFVWDSHKRRHMEMPIVDVAAVARFSDTKFFPEGPEYHVIPLDALAVEWRHHD